MLHFNWVDYVILGVFFLSILAGLMRGFVREIISLVTLIAAFVVAIMFSNKLAILFTHSETVQNAIQASGTMEAAASQPVSYLALAVSFALLFAATVLVGAIFSFFLNLAFQTGILGFSNRLLGSIFGLVRGFIINVVLIFLVQLSPLSDEAWWKGSQLVPRFESTIAWLGEVVSPSLPNLKEKFGKTFEGVNNHIKSVKNALGRPSAE